MPEFIAVVVLLLIVIWFFLKIRNKKSSNTTLKNTLESTKQEPKPADKVVSAAESITPPIATMQENAPISSAEPAQAEQQPFSAPVSHKVAISPENSNKNLPQDSMLKRHYLTHLRTMILSLSPPRPTDSALSRDYDTQIVAKIEQCLNDESAMQQLVFHYEQDKKTLTHSVVKEPKAIIDSSLKSETANEIAVLAQANDVNIPEDSMLRRHYLTHLHSQVAANLPPRPTDSMLRRHYDTLLENAP
jgi:hypothetical protein